jgi:hypothetical protein
MAPRLYFTTEGSLAVDFIVLENPSTLAGFEPANIGSRIKHDN